MNIKPLVIANQIEIDTGLSYGVRAHAFKTQAENAREATDAEENERAEFELWLNEQLTKAFELGVDYKKRMPS